MEIFGDPEESNNFMFECCFCAKSFSNSSQLCSHKVGGESSTIQVGATEDDREHEIEFWPEPQQHSNVLNSHPKNYGRRSHTCRPCGNPHGLIRKYELMFFHINAKEIGFVKYR
ncbi:40S ribosomal protein S29 [Prunus yedoensis var. nudiflora]|uniref:40S ribosomal protein S29 n=1 Tax=Prunus yedoensis var. nudiflora TaxID=2094558 RepID=A0A314XKK7_PRUYE|nr:40S ribosomal protein S29 [Prunus yedoensis var. nudiflora]